MWIHTALSLRSSLGCQSVLKNTLTFNKTQKIHRMTFCCAIKGAANINFGRIIQKTWQCRKIVNVSQVRNMSALCRYLNNKSSYVLKNCDPCGLRHMSTKHPKSDSSIVMYISAVGIFMLGMAYAGVPLYKMFCQATGLGGQATLKGHDTSKVETMNPINDRKIKIYFNADTASSMQWNFKPQQREIQLVPGETALAFYTATNPTDKPVIGVATYNVLPYEAGQYFNKIQCFCFEEQMLNPHEQVDMPVFFYIDPEFDDDPKMEYVESITLSYTFFESKDGLQLPLPGFMRPNVQTQ